MDGSKITRESFLEDVKDHRLTIIKDDGLYRHLRFSKPDSTNMFFDIVTWPGYLAYSGDMGAFMFTRIEDMLGFFRSRPGKLETNTGYWAEKVVAESVFGNGIREFSVEAFRENVLEDTRSWLDLEDGEKIPEDMIEEIAPLLTAGDEWECVEAIRNFDSEEIDFSDFWEHSNNRKTLHFVWCCFALAWGVSKYDEAKTPKDEQLADPS